MLCVVLLLGGNCGEVDAFRARKHFIRNVSRALPFRFYPVFRDAFVFARIFIGFAFLGLGVAVLDISPWQQPKLYRFRQLARCDLRRRVQDDDLLGIGFLVAHDHAFRRFHSKERRHRGNTQLCFETLVSFSAAR